MGGVLTFEEVGLSLWDVLGGQRGGCRCMRAHDASGEVGCSGSSTMRTMGDRTRSGTASS